MGLSGIILRKSDKMNLKKTKKCIFSIAKSLNFIHFIGDEDLKGENHCIINIGDSVERQLIMWLYGKTDKLEYYDWNWIDKKLNRSIIIEDFSGCEDILLKFLHEYFKYYPNDYFNDELDWFYTKEDIDRVYNSSDWEDWCYKKPKAD